MRMWLVDPEVMCRKHLLGEHVEMHMYLGSMKQRKAMLGYLAKNLLEPSVLYNRHEELAAEIERRGWKHNSPMDPAEVSSATRYLGNYAMSIAVDKKAALDELHLRCPDCRRMWKAKYEA